MNEESNIDLNLDKCPHCGEKLSPWQQILLNVDRVLVCKNCWYRIVIDEINDENHNTDNNFEEKS